MPTLSPRSRPRAVRTALTTALVSVGILTAVSAVSAVSAGSTGFFTPGSAEARGTEDTPIERALDLTAEAPRFSWPLAGRPSVTRPFHRPSSPYGPGHRGVDLAAVPGQDVLASAEGRVVFAGRVAGRGVVSIDHPGGLRTTYEPVRWSVSSGQRVHRGQVIGVVEPGHDGCRVEACLHWGVRHGGTGETHYLDPLRLVVPDAPLRLKPWEGTAGPAL